MKKILPLIITIVAIFSIVAVIEQKETDEETFKEREASLLRELERANRIGPKPHFLTVGGRIHTKKQIDSLYDFLSRFTIHELYELRSGIVESKAAAALVDSLIHKKIENGLE